MKDWVKEFNRVLEPAHSLAVGDRVQLSSEFLKLNAGRPPDVLGTVKHSFTASIGVDWDDGVYMLMHCESLEKIS